MATRGLSTVSSRQQPWGLSLFLTLFGGGGLLHQPAVRDFSGFDQRTGGAISYGFVMTYGVITVVNGKSVKPSETIVMIVSVPVIVFPFRDPLNVNCC